MVCKGRQSTVVAYSQHGRRFHTQGLRSIVKMGLHFEFVFIIIYFLLYDTKVEMPGQGHKWAHCKDKYAEHL